jgi:8-oxo-dGTP pyrophosphatase MutT (NUDIX family)
MKTAPQFQRYLDSSYNNLEIDLDEIEIADPPRDDSHTTRMELEELERIIQEAKLPRDIMRVADKDPLHLFYSVAKKKGLDPLEEEAKLWADDWTKLSFEFKLKFKRRRPYEVKKEHDVEFAHHKTDTSESPSYPSGHAMMGYGVAEFYKDKYPLMADEWDNVAEIIAHSRLQMGVHYPSDVEASKKIVDQIADNIKEASAARFARGAIKRNFQSGKGVKVTTQGGGKRVVGNTTRRYTRKKTTTPAAAPTWGQKIKGYGTSVGKKIKDNPIPTAIGGSAVVGGGVMAYNRPQPMGMPKMGSAGHLEQRRSERAKFLSKQELASLEKKVRKTKDLPEGAHYITLPHGRKGIVRTEEGRSHLATILDARMRPPGRDITAKVKTAAEKLRLYHGSPLDLETLEPRQPNKGKWGDYGVYGTPNQLVAALYAIARNDSKGSWGILPDGRLIAKSKKDLNPEGYVYEYDSDDYITPPEDDLGIGYASQSSPEILSKEKVYLDNLRDSITRVDDRDKFLEYFKKTSSEQPLPRVLEKQASLPSLNSILKATQSGLSRVKLDKLADKVQLYRARRNLGIAVKDLRKYQSSTARFGQMPRIVIPKTHLDIPDLYRLGFQDSLIAVPEIGQKTWTTYRHPLDKLHLHDHGKYLNMHIDSLPALQMIAERNSLSGKARRKLMETIPEGIKPWVPVNREEIGLLSKLDDQLSGVGHAILEGGPGYINYALKQLNPRKVSMADEIISKLPKDYLRKRYGIKKVSSVQGKLAAPNRHTRLLEKTSAAQPLLRHRSTLLIRDPKTNKLLAAKETDPNSKASPFFFPGGGLYDDEYSTPRNPSDEDIIEGARREALEELGIELDNPRVVGSYAQELEDWWKEKTLKNRGVPYLGGHEHYVLADRGKEDRSLYNVEGDAFEHGDYYDPTEIVEALNRAASGDSAFAPFNREQVRAIKDNLLQKQANLGNLAHKASQGIRRATRGMRNMVANESTALKNLPVSERTFTVGGNSKTVTTTLADRQRINAWRASRGQKPRNTNPATEFLANPTYRSNVGYHYGSKPAVQTAISLAEPIANHSDDVLNLVSKFSSYGELKKNASDLSVLTAVPTQNLDLIMRKGLYSQKAMLEDPEVLSAFLAQRNADKAWKNDEQYDENRFREQYDKRRKLIEDKGGSIEGLEGPSVFFTEPDPDKVSDPRHFINKFNTETLRVNLAKLLKDIPDTRIHGAELTPWDDEGHDADPDNYYKQVHRDITPEEVSELISRGSKNLWKDYSEESLGRYYAKDVPHAFIRTPSGIIPPEYLEQVEKTSSAKEQLKHILVTGHSGAGKSTYAKELAKELGMPLHELDPRAKDILAEDYPEHEGIGWPGDISERVVREALSLDTPHVIEGTQIHDVPDLVADLRRILVDTPEGRVVEQRAAREYERRKLKNKPYRPMEGHRDAARKLVDYYRESIDNFRNQPGVESIVPEVKQAALEDEFQPDLNPDDLKALGVYDQVYGDAPSEASMKEWPEHWINKQDPLGWLQWYDRYSGGRRTDDDDRQMKRWKSFKARHLAQYLKKPTPRRAAALRNWGIDVGKY